MKKHMKKTVTNFTIVAGIATMVMAAAYAEGSRSSEIDRARNVENAASGRSAEGKMGLAPANLSNTTIDHNADPAAGPSDAKNVERWPNGGSITGSSNSGGSPSSRELRGQPVYK